MNDEKIVYQLSARRGIILKDCWVTRAQRRVASSVRRIIFRKACRNSDLILKSPRAPEPETREKKNTINVERKFGHFKFLRRGTRH